MKAGVATHSTTVYEQTSIIHKEEPSLISLIILPQNKANWHKR